MKIKNENELWLYNSTTADVSISDLGIKVPAGKAINVYQYNPYLTVSKVEGSRSSGALFRRLESRVLMVIVKATNPIPQTLNQLKESNKTVHAKKTKTSVVIEQKTDEPEEDGNFGFADYGITDVGPDVSTSKEDGSVFIHTKQDDAVKPDKGSPLEPVIESGVSNQSQVVMKHMQESMTDPAGLIADATTPSLSQPFTVVKPHQDSEEKESERVTPTGENITKDSSGAVVVGGEKKPRSIKTVKKAQEEGDDCMLPGDDEEGADEAIDLEKTEFDTKVAVKTEDGSVIMKIKEDEPEEKE